MKNPLASRHQGWRHDAGDRARDRCAGAYASCSTSSHRSRRDRETHDRFLPRDPPGGRLVHGGGPPFSLTTLDQERMVTQPSTRVRGPHDAGPHRPAREQIVMIE